MPRAARRSPRARRLALPLVLGWLIFWLTTAASAACGLSIAAKPIGQPAASATGIAVLAANAGHHDAPGTEPAHCPDVSAASFDAGPAASPSNSSSGSGAHLFDYALARNGNAARESVFLPRQLPPGVPLYLRVSRLLI